MLLLEAAVLSDDVEAATFVFDVVAAALSVAHAHTHAFLFRVVLLVTLAESTTRGALLHPDDIGCSLWLLLIVLHKVLLLLLRIRVVKLLLLLLLGHVSLLILIRVVGVFIYVLLNIL